MRLNGPYLFQELQWVQDAGHLAQFGFCCVRNALRLQQPFAGSLRGMVPFGDLSALAILLRQLEGGLEEVHEQARSAIQSGNGLRGSDALETAVAEELAHDGAVLLFDPGLIVLAPRSGARELDPVAEAVLDQSLVHKLAAVIHVQCSQSEGQSLANTIERLNDQAALPNYQRRSLGPAAGYVGQHQAVDVAASVSLPAMRDQIHLHASRRRLVPIRKRAHGDTPTRRGHRAADLLQACRATRYSQQPINGRSAHGQNLLAHRLSQMQMSVALQRWQQDRQQSTRALPTYPIGGLP